MIKSHSFSYVFKNVFLWWLENPYSPLSVFTGTLPQLLCQQSFCSLNSSSMVFISLGYLDIATIFCVSACPVKLNKTGTSPLLSYSRISMSLVSSVAFLCSYFPVNSAFLKRDDQNPTQWVFTGLRRMRYHCPHLTSSFKHRSLRCPCHFQELILGVDATQRQAAPPRGLCCFLPRQGRGLVQWMSSFYDFLEVRGRISKAMTLGERSALSPARDWPRVVVFAKPSFYGAFVTWRRAGRMVGACIAPCCCGLCTPSEEPDPEINHSDSSEVDIAIYTS